MPNPKNNRPQKAFNVDFNPFGLNLIKKNDIRLSNRNGPSKDNSKKHEDKIEELKEKDHKSKETSNKSPFPE